MNSKRGGDQSNRKGKNVATDDLIPAVQGVSLDSNPAGWVVLSNNNKNKNANASGSGSGSAWGGWDSEHGRVGIPPPLQGGWNWKGRRVVKDSSPTNPEEDDDDIDELDDSDDEYMSDSDESPKSHEARKKNRWYASFFATLDAFTVDQINQPKREWHCPACKNGPGAIDWYPGIQSLLVHAKTRRSKRAKLHRDFAQVLEQELLIRGATVIPSGEGSYGQWKGLNQEVKDKEIVWPPMVVVMNTQLEQDVNGKWVGMGNQELLDYFESYEAMKARHSYGPRGHRGMSLLIFEASAVGYTEAERLSKHFEDEGTDRDAWDHHRVLFYPGGKRQLYGFMATKEDLEIFNQHSSGKYKLKFSLVSYEQNVVNQLKQMSEDNQQLKWFKNKVAKEQMHSQALEESFGLIARKLRKMEEENRVVRERTRRYHEQNKEEMDYQEEFFKEQLKVIQDARSAREGQFDEMQQEEQRRMQNKEEKLDDMKGFEEEREKLVRWHAEKKAEMKKMHWNEELELEDAFNEQLSQLMDKYTHKHDGQKQKQKPKPKG